MEKLRVELGKKSYDIFFNKGFSDLAGVLESVNAPKKLLVVTDTNVEKLYLGEVMDILLKNGYDASSFSFPAGEENKNMDTILSICNACVQHNMDRKSMILALGGGVVGDMAGFAASIYMRGIDFIGIPTTLLSQSDSSVGGKTGIDFMGAKNILGAFHQPKAVYINVNTVKTLPEREFISGMGEVIKHALIADEKFFDYLQGNRDKISSYDEDTLLKTAYKNCSIKAGVVSRDEFENDERAKLNFGHTIGHAVEGYSEFTKTHGECVALGIMAVSHIAYKRGLITEEYLKKVCDLFISYGFSLNCEINDFNAVKEIMKKDKKSKDGKIKFILPNGIGNVIAVYDISPEETEEALLYINR